MSNRGHRDWLLSAGKHIIDEPLSLLLTNHGFADHSALLEHIMRRLQNALQMRRISLCERELLANPVQRDPPGQCPTGSRDFDQAIEPPSDRGGQREVSGDAEGDDVPRRHVLPDDRRNDDSGFARLGGNDRWEERELIPLE